MRGHKAILEMRRQGVAPSIVFIDTEPSRLREWRDWQDVDASMASVEIATSDTLASLDLRFVHSLRVMVTGENAPRVKAIGAACERAGAARVVASTMERRGAGEFMTMKAVAVTDTAGELSYPKTSA